MKPKIESLIAVALVLVSALALQAQAPTSRRIPFTNLQTTLQPDTPGQAVTVQLWDVATGGTTPLITEARTVDTVGTQISFVFGDTLASGLDPANFPSGSDRFLDVVDGTGASVLVGGRIPLTAVAFALNPGPQGPQGIQGLQGIQGPPGPQGSPGVVQSVSAGDASIAVGGSLATPMVSVATNGITNAKVADGALSAAKITGTAATLGPNNFVGAENVNGSIFVNNPNGAAVDATSSIVGLRGAVTGAGGFAIVGSAPANAIAGQFNGAVNVTGPLSAGANLRVEGGVSASSAGLFDIDAPFTPGGRLRIAVNGNVGIGTPSPSAKLDVAGDIKSSGRYVGDGSGLTNLTATNALALGGVAPNGYALAAGSPNYIQNGTTPQGASLNITGSASASTLNANNGVYGNSGNPNSAGVGGSNSSGGTGVFGTGAYGVFGDSNAAYGFGVHGQNSLANGIGVYGNSGSGGTGVYGSAFGSGSTGVYGNGGSAGNGVYGTGGVTGTGVSGASISGAGGLFTTNNGNILLGFGGSPTPTQKFVVDSAGKVIAAGGFNGTCASGFGGVFYPVICNQDLAETFRTLEATEPGDLVVLVTQPGTIPTVRKSSRAYEGLLLGAVATNPGLVFDNGETHLAGDNSKLITPDKTAVGLVGRVPVKVSMENGPIAVGDPITSSSSSGTAMKATSAGQIIGYALEKADQKGKILVHLQPGYYIPPRLLAALNQQDFVANLHAQQAEVEDLRSQISKLERLLQTVLAQRSEAVVSMAAGR